jgi:hypothetical protein
MASTQAKMGLSMKKRDMGTPLWDLVRLMTRASDQFALAVEAADADAGASAGAETADDALASTPCAGAPGCT